MRTLVASFSTALVLSACATSKPIQGPNGGTAYLIKCGSAVIDACYEEAAKVCPKGYAFADRQTNPNGVIIPAGNSLLMARGPNSMLIECKP
jgi:hypothetical protein